jgi:very-short-patch-repair endonuclease
VLGARAAGAGAAEEFGPYRADFTFAPERLVVECDSRRWHDNDVNFLTDRQKARFIRSCGYEVAPYTWAEVVHEPARVAGELRTALARRRRELRVR